MLLKKENSVVPLFTENIVYFNIPELYILQQVPKSLLFQCPPVQESNANFPDFCL